MSFQPGAVINTQGFGNRPESVEVPHIDVRAPSPADGVKQQFPVGKMWVDTIDNAIYGLTSFQAFNGITTANWILLSSSTGPIETIVTDAGTVLPVGGDVNFHGGTNQLQVTGSGNTATFNLSPTIVTPGSLTVNGAFTQVGTASINATGGATTTIGSSVAGNISITNLRDILIASVGGDISIETAGTPISIGENNSDMTVNIGNGPAVKFVNIGSSVGASMTTIQTGLGGLFINTISGGTTNMGSSVAGDYVVESGSDISIATFGGDIHLNGQNIGNVMIEAANLMIIDNGFQLQVKGNSATDFIGSATLVTGSAIVANTNIAANDIILMQHINIGASTALGTLTYTINPGVSFLIVSHDSATPASIQTGDLSSIAYFIVRQLP